MNSAPPDTSQTCAFSANRIHVRLLPGEIPFLGLVGTLGHQSLIWDFLKFPTKSRSKRCWGRGLGEGATRAQLSEKAKGSRARRWEGFFRNCSFPRTDLLECEDHFPPPPARCDSQVMKSGEWGSECIVCFSAGPALSPHRQKCQALAGSVSEKLSWFRFNYATERGWTESQKLPHPFHGPTMKPRATTSRGLPAKGQGVLCITRTPIFLPALHLCWKTED